MAKVEFGVHYGFKDTSSKVSQQLAKDIGQEFSEVVKRQFDEYDKRISAIEQIAKSFDGENNKLDSSLNARLSELEKSIANVKKGITDAASGIQTAVKNIDIPSMNLDGIFDNADQKEIYNQLKAIQDYDDEVNKLVKDIQKITETDIGTIKIGADKSNIEDSLKQWESAYNDVSSNITKAIANIQEQSEMAVPDRQYQDIIKNMKVIRDNASELYNIYAKLQNAQDIGLLDNFKHGTKTPLSEVANIRDFISDVERGVGELADIIDSEFGETNQSLKILGSANEDVSSFVSDAKEDFSSLGGDVETLNQLLAGNIEQFTNATKASDVYTKGIDERVAALEREIEAFKELAKQRENATSIVAQTTDSNVKDENTEHGATASHVSDTEIESLKVLQAAVDAVTESVRVKNKAFIDEEDIVTNSIGKEISALSHLEETVNAVISKFTSENGFKLDINVPVDAFKKTAEQSVEMSNAAESVDSLKANLESLKDILRGSFDFSSIEASINSNVTSILAAIDRVIAKLNTLQSVLQAVANNVAPTNVTESLDKSTIDTFNQSIKAIQAMQKAVDKLVQSNKDLADSFKNAGSASKKYKVDPLFDANNAIANDEQRLWDSSDKAIKDHLLSKGETGFNVMDRSIQRTSDGLVQLTTVVDSGGEHWRKFITIIGQAGKGLEAVIDKITGAQKQQSIYESILQRKQILAQSATDDALFDVNRAGDLQKWESILDEIYQKYSQIGEIQKIIYQTRQDKATGTLLESFVVKGKNSSVTFGPNGNAVASNQEVINLEAVEKKIKNINPELKNYWELKVQASDADDPFNKSAQQQIDATDKKLQEIYDDLNNIKNISENLEIKNVAESLMDEMGQTKNSGFTKVIETQINAMNKKLVSEGIQRANTNTGYSKELQNQINEYKAARKSVEDLLSSHLNGETWTDDEIQSVSQLTQLINQLNISLKNSSDKMADLMSVSKLLEKVSKYANENTKNPLVNMRFSGMIGELNAIIDRAKKTNSVISDMDKLSLRNITGEFQNLKGQLEASGETGLNLFDRLKNTISAKNAQFLSMYFSLFDVIRYIQQATTVIKEYDSALIDMQKVSEETKSTLKNYASTLFDVGNSLGANALTLEKSTADFLRIGESLQEASESAKQAQLLMNVSEFNSIEDATNALISASQAYQNVDKSEIVDKINKLGNDFPIATDELASALQESAAALATQGNSIDEATALIVGGELSCHVVQKCST